MAAVAGDVPGPTVDVAVEGVVGIPGGTEVNMTVAAGGTKLFCRQRRRRNDKLGYPSGHGIHSQNLNIVIVLYTRHRLFCGRQTT